MYYGGDLQSGIAKAVEESKSVVCFIVGMLDPRPEGGTPD